MTFKQIADSFITNKNHGAVGNRDSLYQWTTHSQFGS